MTRQQIETMHQIGDIMDAVINQIRARQDNPPTGELDGDMTIEALTSWYGDTTFRSKLEADWAATLDTFGIAWEYEPETITLPSGSVYIPDFWLPQIGTWLEVKGPGVPRVEKAYELAAARACHCQGRCSCAHHGGELVLIGHVPTPLQHRDDDRYWSDYWERRRHDNERKRTPGHLAWTVAHGPEAYMATCQRCGVTSWAPLRYRGCRACRKRYDNTPVYRSGSKDLFFVNSDGLPRPEGAAVVPAPAPATA
ncbi:hypothetical protein [Nocardiopsis synnemataformans]|uniref:hypothetical protein n=1 Tax=Nocardiopsis synnemataformans TaxID=61305 RepID=UPI003EB7E074